MRDAVEGDPTSDIKKILLADFPSESLTLDRFTGDGLLQRIAEPDAELRVSHVRFEAGAQTRPHFHRGLQILWFLQGSGEVASPNNVVPCEPGDIVRIGPYVEHWHGAAGTGSTSHLAITVGKTVWENKEGWDQRR
jgi:quercetin dioxygenase-like cupin family protein